jgi:hypothetical protein
VYTVPPVYPVKALRENLPIWYQYLLLTVQYARYGTGTGAGTVQTR